MPGSPTAPLNHAVFCEQFACTRLLSKLSVVLIAVVELVLEPCRRIEGGEHFEVGSTVGVLMHHATGTYAIWAISPQGTVILILRYRYKLGYCLATTR